MNPYLVNAGTQHITLRTGGSFVHHADSFAIARGGHLDLCVLGAFEVAEDTLTASDRLLARYPNAQPWFVRIGHRAVHRFGPRRVAEPA